MKHPVLLSLLALLTLAPACDRSSSSSGGGDDTSSDTDTDTAKSGCRRS